MGIVAVFVVVVGPAWPTGSAVLGDSDLEGYQRVVLAAMFGASLLLWMLAFIIRRRRDAGTAARQAPAPPAGGELRGSDGEDAHSDTDPLEWEPPPPPWAHR
jgi:hypothetical protein